MKFLEEDTKIDMMVFMIQRKLHKDSCRPGSKEYGALSVAVQLFKPKRF